MARVGNFCFDIFVALVVTALTFVIPAVPILMIVSEKGLRRGLVGTWLMLKRSWVMPFQNWRHYG